jgi:hypothetical protein
MKSQWLLWPTLLLLMYNCALSPISPPPPATIRTVAVLPPYNRTGDSLLVAGSSLLETYVLRSRPVTVGDVLAADIRAQLAQRGYTVVTPEAVEAAIGSQVPHSPQEAADLTARGKLEGSVLYVQINRWEPGDETLHPRSVLVAVDASLIDATMGRVVWSAHLPLRPVPTPGAVTPGAAYTLATHEVTKELLTAWGPERQPS